MHEEAFLEAEILESSSDASQFLESSNRHRHRVSEYLQHADEPVEVIPER